MFDFVSGLPRVSAEDEKDEVPNELRRVSDFRLSSLSSKASTYKDDRKKEKEDETVRHRPKDREIYVAEYSEREPPQMRGRASARVDGGVYENVCCDEPSK